MVKSHAACSKMWNRTFPNVRFHNQLPRMVTNARDLLQFLVDHTTLFNLNIQTYIRFTLNDKFQKILKYILSIQLTCIFHKLPHSASIRPSFAYIFFFLESNKRAPTLFRFLLMDEQMADGLIDGWQQQQKQLSDKWYNLHCLRY